MWKQLLSTLYSRQCTFDFGVESLAKESSIKQHITSFYNSFSISIALYSCFICFIDCYLAIIFFITLNLLHCKSVSSYYSVISKTGFYYITLTPQKEHTTNKYFYHHTSLTVKSLSDILMLPYIKCLT